MAVEELLARLRVTERRLAAGPGEQTSSSVFVNGKLRIEYSAGCAYLEDEELHLTPIEYKLLCLLSKNVGKVLTHTFITQNIWGHSWENDVASLRVFMATLRKKLEKNSDSVQYIQTHVGVGYRMMRVEGEEGETIGLNETQIQIVTEELETVIELMSKKTFETFDIRALFI